jgi:hypothetical protein
MKKFQVNVRSSLGRSDGRRSVRKRRYHVQLRILQIAQVFNAWNSLGEPRITAAHQVIDGMPQNGTGLGLAITERAFRLHRGDVTAANALGGGLVVTLELPMVESNHQSSVDNVASPL